MNEKWMEELYVFAARRKGPGCLWVDMIIRTSIFSYEICVSCQSAVFWTSASRFFDRP